MAENGEFWNYALDSIAIFATSDLFKVYRLQRPVRELAVVANSFHTKPLMRILQSVDRYHVLGLNRQQATLFEGNRYALDEVELAPGFPRTASELVGVKEGKPERKNRVYGPAGPGRTTRHGTARMFVNPPTGMRARLLKGASTLVHGPVQTKTLTEGVITLEFATMLQLAASDEIRLQIWFSGTDGYAPQNLTGMWGHLVGRNPHPPESSAGRAH